MREVGGLAQATVTETQNDDFDAREYTWRFGRWLSSDWSATPEAVPYANLSNPQTLNLYAMVEDDPESFADLDGHDESVQALTTCNGAGGNPGCSPKNTQLQAQNTAVQVGKDTVVGAAKEAANTIIGLSNAVNSVVDSVLGLTGSSFSFGQTAQLQASTPGESSAMLGTSAALLVVGGPELKSADAIAFGKSLASEGQIAETGTAIAGSGSSVALRDSGRLATTYGGNAADWSKMTSSAYRAGDGSVVSTHWYENAANAIRVEYKSIIDKAPW